MTVAVTQKSIDELRPQAKSLESQSKKVFEEYSKDKYGIDSEYQALEDALKTMKDHAQKLRRLEFDIIGIQARIDKINKFLAEHQKKRENAKNIVDKFIYKEK